MAEWEEFDWQGLMRDWRADEMTRGYADTPEGQVHYVTAGMGTPSSSSIKACGLPVCFSESFPCWRSGIDRSP